MSASAIRKAERAKGFLSLAAFCMSFCNRSLSPIRYRLIFFIFFNARFLAASAFFLRLTLGFS
jgi:hypothetical protein